MRVGAVAGSAHRDHASSVSSSALGLGSDELLNDLRVSLAAGLAHHLADEEAHRLHVTVCDLGNGVLVGGQNGVDCLLDRTDIRHLHEVLRLGDLAG